ncbi:MAG: glycosyltransferase family 2 protein [Acidobacteriota bacterium]
MSAPRVAIVLLALPTQVERTQRCLDSLAELDARPAHSILLWIQGAQDPAPIADGIRARHPTVRVVHHGHNLGVAGGRNAAAHRILNDAQEPPSHLFFLDNDMTVEPDLLGRLLEVVDEPSIGLATGKILSLDDPDRLYGAGGCRIRFWRGDTGHVGRGELDRGQYDRRSDILPSGGCFLVRTDVFEALGGFDEVFSPYGPEDLDFGLRARADGWQARYAPRAIAYHPTEPGRSFGDGREGSTYVANRVRQWLRFLRRHGSPLDQLGFTLVGGPWIAARMLIRALFHGRLTATLRGLLRSVG